MSTEPAKDGATPKERNELLLGLLKDHYAGIVDFEFKHGTLLALALGWLITSESARIYLSEHGLARYGLCGMVLLLTCLHARWAYAFWKRSATVYQQLARLEYVPKEDVECQRIPIFTLVSYVVIHAAVTVVLCVLVLGG